MLNLITWRHDVGVHKIDNKGKYKVQPQCQYKNDEIHRIQRSWWLGASTMRSFVFFFAVDGQGVPLPDNRWLRLIWRLWRKMVVAPRDGHDVCKARSLDGLWLGHGRYCSRNYRHMDLMVNDIVWNHYQPRKLMNTKTNKKWLPIFMPDGTPDAPAIGSTLPEEQGPSFHLHLLYTVEVVLKLKEVFLRNLYLP